MRKPVLPKMPKVEQTMPGMPPLPQYGAELRRLQGHFGLLGKAYGKYANNMRPTKTNGGK